MEKHKPLTEGPRKGGRNGPPKSARPSAPPPGQGRFKLPVTAKLMAREDAELCGPYECPMCSGHMMLDVTFLDQVNEVVTCPYCKTRITPEDV